MINSKFGQKGLLLTSTVISLFCIGCSTSTLPNLSQTGNKISANQIQTTELNALKVQADKGNTDTMTATIADKKTVVTSSTTASPSDSINPNHTSSPVMSNPPPANGKRPCPPPPPPCNQASEDNRQQANQIVISPDSSITGSPAAEGIDNPPKKVQRPCPPPPPPCKEAGSISTDTQQNNSQKKESDKKHCHLKESTGAELIVNSASENSAVAEGDFQPDQAAPPSPKKDGRQSNAQKPNNQQRQGNPPPRPAKQNSTSQQQAVTK